MNLLPLLFIPFLVGGGISSKQQNNASDPEPLDTTISCGEFYEAENGSYNNCSVITNNPNASGKKALDAGDGGYVTFSFNVEETGYYDLVVGYYTENTGAKIGVTVNGDFNSYPVQYTNGWCKDTTKYAIEHIIRDVELYNVGNMVKIQSDNIGKAKYLNFDYIRLVKTNKADGTRIQFEDFYRYIGGDGYGRSYTVSTNADSKVFSLDDNISAKPVYSVEIEEADTYMIQFAYYSSADAKYRFNITNDDSFSYTTDLSIPKAYGGFPNAGEMYYPYSSKCIFKVDLPVGKINFSMNYIRNGFVDYDWFRIYRVSEEINTVIEAEDVTTGDANIDRHSSMYPVLSEYAVELAAGNASFNVNVTENKLYRLYVGGYSATSNAYINISLDGGAFVKTPIGAANATGWSTDVSDKNVFYFEYELTKGTHNFTIKKGGDEISGNYVDLDYFMVIPNKVNITSIELDHTDKKQFIIDDSVIDFVSEYTLDIKNKNVAVLEGNIIKPVSSGSTVLYIKYYINGAFVQEEIPINVTASTDFDYTLFEVKNTTRTYNGSRQYVDVTMPEGWSFTQDGDTPNVGTYVVTVTFHHPNYVSYVYPGVITLTIVKGIYEGNDLFADDQTVTYDGEEHQYVASAPNGWTISYSDNVFKDIGEYEIEVTFTHEYYETVVKTAKFTILPDSGSNVAADSIPLIIAISVIVGVAGLAVGGYFIFKKYKENHEVIK